MLTLASIWVVVGIGLVLVNRRSSAGMPLAYFLGLSLIHVPGAMLYLNSEYWNSMTDVTRVGFEQTVIGMVAFLVAVIVVRYTAFVQSSRRASVRRPLNLTTQHLAALDRLAYLYMSLGGIAYFVLLPLFGNVSTITAVISSLGALIMVGACLRLWVALQKGNRIKFWSTIALLPLLPLATLIQGGFIGFGTYWVLGIVSFLFAQSKRRVGYVLLAPVVFFVGLSVFVNYMASRTEIRRIVWHQQADLSDRFQGVAEGIFANFEWLDFSNRRHRRAIEDRLNQNLLVGAAVARLESGLVEFASGATVGDMIMALIPRAFWPDKPLVGGGKTLVQDFTGMIFPEGTSVGAGQVLEFYVNFGTIGVIGGFLLYGCLVGSMDLWIIEYLTRGDQRRFLFWFLICIALLQPGGNLLEIVVSAASSAITAYGLGHLLIRHWPAGDTPNIPRATIG